MCPNHPLHLYRPVLLKVGKGGWGDGGRERERERRKRKREGEEGGGGGEEEEEEERGGEKREEEKENFSWCNCGTVPTPWLGYIHPPGLQTMKEVIPSKEIKELY